MSPRVQNLLPPDASQSRPKPPRKPIGIRNRGKSLAGREGPADPRLIVRSPSGSTVKKEGWSPRDVSFADSSFDPVFERKKVYDELNTLLDWDDYHDGFQIGRLSESPRARRKTPRTWWIHRTDLLKQFLKHLQTKVRWPVARAGLVLYWYYVMGYSDERIYEERRWVFDDRVVLEDFPSVNAVTCFRQRLITMGVELFGPDPESVSHSVWDRERVHEYAPGEGMNPAAPDWQKDWTEAQLPPEPKPELDPEPDPEPVVTDDSSCKG